MHVAFLVFIVLFVGYSIRIRLIPVFLVYLEDMRYFSVLLAVSIEIPLIASYFVLKHTGVDANFEFAWLHPSNSSNASTRG